MRLSPDTIKQRIQHIPLCEDELVHHGREGTLQIELPDGLHGAGADVFQMLTADPNRILKAPCCVDVPFKFSAALSADKHPGKRILACDPQFFLFDVLLPRPLLQECSCSLKVFPADDRLMMIFHIELIALAVIVVPAKAEIRVGLLEQAVADVLFICKHSPDRGARPVSVSPCGYLFLVELPRNRTA